MKGPAAQDRSIVTAKPPGPAPPFFMNLIALVEDLAGQMGLSEWEILVTEELSDPDGAEAEVFCTYAQHQATLAVGEDWDRIPLRDLKLRLTHELVHLHLDRLETTVGRFLDRLPKSLRETARQSLVDEVEYATDSISRAWSPNLVARRRAQADPPA